MNRRPQLIRVLIGTIRYFATNLRRMPLAPQTSVTADGLIQIPDDVREDLGLVHGGGIVFIRDKHGHYLMLTNDQYFNLFEER